MKKVNKILMETLKISRRPEVKTGGQSCGIMSTGIKLESEIGISVSVNVYRSQFKNKALASLLMELAIDEVIK